MTGNGLQFLLKFTLSIVPKTLSVPCVDHTKKWYTSVTEQDSPIDLYLRQCHLNETIKIQDCEHTVKVFIFLHNWYSIVILLKLLDIKSIYMRYYACHISYFGMNRVLNWASSTQNLPISGSHDCISFLLYIWYWLCSDNLNMLYYHIGLVWYYCRTFSYSKIQVLFL